MTIEQELSVDDRIEELQAKLSDFEDRGYSTSAVRVANELRRLTRSEGVFDDYVRATFTIMNNAGTLLDPNMCREAAIEMIGLLENEDRARAIEPDLNDEDYMYIVNWYSSCAYDNLAKATAQMNGYNSDGVHAGIAEGIDVCRRTGKTQCITCFREYASDVYLMADDSDMALHYARMSLNQTSGKGDRRLWAAARDEISILYSRGQLSAVVDRVDRVIELTETWHSPHGAKLTTKPFLTELAIMLGEPNRWAEHCNVVPPPTGEDPAYDMQVDKLQALMDVVDGDFDAAIKRLGEWDQKLLRKKCLDHWFNVRLRLLAAHRMAGNEREFEKLGEQLKKKAAEARDWYTLRCLKRLQSDANVISPVPTLEDFDCGPYSGANASEAPQVAANEQTAARESEARDQEAEEQTEARETPEFVVQIIEKLKAASRFDEETQSIHMNAEAIDDVLTDIIGCDPELAKVEGTAEWLLQTLSHIIPDGSRAKEIWSWAKRFVAPLRQDAMALNLFARLGCVLLFRFEEEMAGEVTVESLEQMFRESLDMDPEQRGNFERAGDFFDHVENMGEAERCFARSFRLDRKNPDVASKLARVYRQTDRERDALNVLDMAIREGAEDPELLWEAAVSAHSLSIHQAALTYLIGYEKQAPNRPWANHYRASSLIALERFDEALAAVEREVELNPECEWTSLVLRAACLAGLKQEEQLRSVLNEWLAIPFSRVDYLRPKGFEKMFALAWTAIESLGAEDELYVRVQDRLLASNMTPDSMYLEEGRSKEPVDDVNVYWCTFEQPLGDQWQDWPGRFGWEEGMDAYRVTWGVVAQSEADAVEFAKRWQDRCYPLDAPLPEVQLADEGYRARTGVIWQGIRQPANVDASEG